MRESMEALLLIEKVPKIWHVEHAAVLIHEYLVVAQITSFHLEVDRHLIL